MKAYRCNLCGRKIAPVKGRVPSHLTFGGQKCFAVGADAAQMAAHRKLIDNIRHAQTPPAR